MKGLSSAAKYYLLKQAAEYAGGLAGSAIGYPLGYYGYKNMNATTAADVFTGGGASFNTGTYQAARYRTRKRRRRMSLKRKIWMIKRRRFRKRVRSVIRASHDKKYTSTTGYIETIKVAPTNESTASQHLCNHRIAVFNFHNPGNTTIPNSVNLGKKLVFPSQGAANAQYEGRGYTIKGFLLRWNMKVPVEDIRASVRLRLVQAKSTLTFRNTTNAAMGEMWSRINTGLDCINETLGELYDEYRILKSWDLHDSILYSQVNSNDMARSGKIWIPFRCNVKDALETVNFYGDTIPMAASKLLRWYFVMTIHVQGRAVGYEGGTTNNPNLESDFSIICDMEMHYYDN